MKKVLVIAIALTFVATAALAGGNPAHKIAIHVKAHPTSCTKAYPAFTSCSGIVFTWNGVPDIDVMPVFYDLAAYTVVETGLAWPAGWGTMSWVRCKGDLSVGGISNPGDGTAIAWTVCQYGWSVAPGYGWVFAADPGMVCPVPNPATGDYGVVDCSPTPGPYYDYPMCVSCAGVFMVGDDPCRPTATEQSTWGEIKSMFK